MRRLLPHHVQSSLMAAAAAPPEILSGSPFQADSAARSCSPLSDRPIEFATTSRSKVAASALYCKRKARSKLATKGAPFNPAGLRAHVRLLRGSDLAGSGRAKLPVSIGSRYASCRAAALQLHRHPAGWLAVHSRPACTLQGKQTGANTKTSKTATMTTTSTMRNDGWNEGWPSSLEDGNRNMRLPPSSRCCCCCSSSSNASSARLIEKRRPAEPG